MEKELQGARMASASVPAGPGVTPLAVGTLRPAPAAAGERERAGAGGGSRSSAPAAAGLWLEQARAMVATREFAGAPLWAWLYVAASCAVGPLVWLLVALGLPITEAERPAPGAADKGAAPPRVAYLDLWRLLCVSIMVASHAGEALEVYVDYNVLAGQQWVLPIIMLIAGKCFAMSRLPVAHYAARLLVYFSVGSLLNWSTAVLTGFHWWECVTTRGVTFQMFFVLGLAVAAVAASPLKAALQAEAEAAGALLRIAAYGLALVVVTQAVSLGNRLAGGGEELGSQLPRVVAEAGVTAVVAMAGRRLLPAPQLDLLGWLLLVWIYATRVLHAEPRPGTELHFHELFVFAVSVHLVPLRWQESIGLGFTRWWPVLLVAGGMLLHPGLRQRLDLLPPPSGLERARHYLVECACVLAFTTIPALGPERTFRVPDVRWLNNWALFAYCAHFAIYRLLPNELGVAVVLASAVPFAAVSLRGQRHPEEGRGA